MTSPVESIIIQHFLFTNKEKRIKGEYAKVPTMKGIADWKVLTIAGFNTIRLVFIHLKVWEYDFLLEFSVFTQIVAILIISIRIFCNYKQERIYRQWKQQQANTRLKELERGKQHGKKNFDTRGNGAI